VLLARRLLTSPDGARSLAPTTICLQVEAEAEAEAEDRGCPSPPYTATSEPAKRPSRLRSEVALSPQGHTHDLHSAASSQRTIMQWQICTSRFRSGCRAVAFCFSTRRSYAAMGRCTVARVLSGRGLGARSHMTMTWLGPVGLRTHACSDPGLPVSLGW
jgi:hypothetical protein